jgi:hypothetical protein
LLGFQKATTLYLEKFGNTLLSPFSSNGKLKLIVVMVIFPVILNALNFWIIDNILKFKPDNETDGDLISVYEKATDKSLNKTKNKSNIVGTVLVN